MERIQVAPFYLILPSISTIFLMIQAFFLSNKAEASILRNTIKLSFIPTRSSKQINSSQHQHQQPRFLFISERNFSCTRSSLQLQKLPQEAFSPSSNPPRVRFAPSPTGQLHLGGLRTALFNHLFARRWNGKWILRIEDTDRNRLVPGATEALIETLRWAGLEYDEGPDKPGELGPYIQSQRLSIYQKYAEQLISSGKAYRDFRPQIARDPKSKGPSRIREKSQYLPPSEDEAQSMIREGHTFVVRLIHPPKTTSHLDLVYNQLTFPADHNAEDPILLKSDGWPTYHLASVVDDHLMKISHVIRGEEWLPSLPLHLHLYQSLGFPIPFFAHLPLLINPDGTKLSKRTGDTRVQDYREKGFDGESLCNFVALMGWNHHNRNNSEGSQLESSKEGLEGDKDVMTLKEMEKSFSMSEVSHSRAALFLPKLAFLNRRHLTLKLSSDTERPQLLSRLKQLLTDMYVEIPARLLEDRYLIRVISFIQERADTLPEMAKQADFLFEDPKWGKDEGLRMLKGVRKEAYEQALTTALEFLRGKSSEDLQPEESSRMTSDLHELSKELKIDSHSEGKKSTSLAALMKPLRHALTGRKAGPTVADTLSILGLELSIARIESALKWSQSRQDWA